MYMKKLIYMISSAAEAASSLSRQLGLHGYEVEIAHSAETALAESRDRKPDLILLDVDLPDMDGCEVCKLLRRQGVGVPILLMADKAADADVILGLDAGANDYICRPIRFGHLLARTRAHVRTFEAGNSSRIQLGRFTFAPSGRVIHTGESVSVNLTEKETQVLRYLWKAGGARVTREELLTEVWGYNPKANSHTVATHVYRLRQKLERAFGPDCVLRTEDQGYSLQLRSADTLASVADDVLQAVTSNDEDSVVVRRRALGTPGWLGAA
jgi:DNA-binding response OmpR family regulator